MNPFWRRNPVDHKWYAKLINQMFDRSINDDEDSTDLPEVNPVTRPHIDPVWYRNFLEKTLNRPMPTKPPSPATGPATEPPKSISSVWYNNFWNVMNNRKSKPTGASRGHSAGLGGPMGEVKESLAGPMGEVKESLAGPVGEVKESLGEGDLTWRRVLEKYDAEREDELSIREGDRVMAIHKFDDGWSFGLLRRNNALGFFPSSFTE